MLSQLMLCIDKKQHTHNSQLYEEGKTYWQIYVVQYMSGLIKLVTAQCYVDGTLVVDTDASDWTIEAPCTTGTIGTDGNYYYVGDFIESKSQLRAPDPTSDYRYYYYAVCTE